METERLTLREFTIGDVPAVQRYAADPLVTRYMIWGPNKLEETEQFVAQDDSDQYSILEDEYRADKRGVER